MSEVTDAGGSGQGPGDAELSGYLCGACETPLPRGAGVCPACGTPVAPLDDDEMVAGPYVISDLPPPPDSDDPPSPDPTAFAPGAAGYTGNGTDHATAAERSAPGEYVPPRDGGVTLDLADPGGPGAGAPTDDPMLGWGPTSEAPAPPLQQRGGPAPTTGRPGDGADEEPLLQRLQAADSRVGQRSRSRLTNAAVLGVAAIVAIVAVAAAGIVLLNSGSGDPGASPTTTAAQPAPPPQGRNSTVAPTTTPAQPTAAADLAKYCVSARLLILDSDPDSLAAKLLSQTSQVVYMFDQLADNAPDETRETATQLRDAVRVVEGKVTRGELRTAGEIRSAVGPTGTPLWPRFDVLNSSSPRICPNR